MRAKPFVSIRNGLFELADKYNMPPQRAHAMLLSGWGHAIATDFDEGMSVMEAEFARASQIGPLFRYYAALLAEGRQKPGRYADALTLLGSAIATVTEPGVGFYVSELYRLQGTCLLQADAANQDEAMRSLRTAVDIARQQGATMLELKAATSLARAAIAIGRPSDGLDALRDLCAALPPQFEAPSLVEAKQLLSG